MTPEEAELKIQGLVHEVQAVRDNPSFTGQHEADLIEEIDAEIRELKKITGPRIITGTYGE